MSQRMSFDFGFGPQGAQPREPDAPMRLLLIGDFSGRPSAERPPLASRPTLRVDLDELDRVMAQLAPRVATGAGEMVLSTLDDFHPDALFRTLALFGALRDARTQPPPASGAESSPLSALLGGTPAGAAGARTSAGNAGENAIDALIRSVIAPHIVADRQQDTRAYVAAIDSAISEQMRQVLHDPAFQTREAAWRGVQWLVANLELDETLQLHLFDVSREELLADLAAAGGKLEQTGVFAALVDRARRQPGALPWSTLIGLDRFGASDTDIGLLAAMGMLAAQAGGPFLAAGDLALAQADAPGHENWTALRRSDVARWIGLVAPRMLLRRPYGARDEKIESFAFEELGNTPAHEQYLWGSGALACALALGRGYRSAEGWDFSPGEFGGIDDLPTATRLDRDGERELVPSAERFLADTQAEALLASGLMPLLSHRHQNAARLLRWQSIAQPAATLAGLPA